MTTPSTSVPALQITPTGVVIPSEQSILTGVQADMNAAFGGNLNPALTTPQGQLAQSMTAIVGDCNAAIAQLVSQVDPANAEGRMQDAIGNIYFITRIPAEPTVLQVACVGSFGTTIPTGASISDTSGNIYTCTSGSQIPASGTVTLQFQATVFGPIAVPSSVSIYQAIAGWDMATIVSGVEGQNVESQQQFELRRQKSVALNASGSVPSILANVLQVAGVTDAFVVDNPQPSTVDYGATNYPLAPNSIYVAAVGGVASAIADAIWLRKSCGANWNGNTAVTVTDTSSLATPQPTYSVSFNVPTDVPILFSVQIKNSTSLPSNIVSLVQNAIINAFAGGDGGPRARIASAIYASRFYPPVNAVAPNLQIVSIQLGTVSANLNAVTMGIDQEPTVIASNISVTLV